MKRIQNISPNWPYYLAAIGCFIILKLIYRQTKTQDLFLLLWPTNQLVELFTGTQSVFIAETGFFYESLQILIDKSCSGFNYWLICFLMLVFLAIKYYDKPYQKVLVCMTSFVSAFFITLFVNSSRIIASIVIDRQNITSGKIDKSIIHEFSGIVIYLTFLIFIYFFLERVLKHRKNYAKLTQSSMDSHN